MVPSTLTIVPWIRSGVGESELVLLHTLSSFALHKNSGRSELERALMAPYTLAFEPGLETREGESVSSHPP